MNKSIKAAIESIGGVQSLNNDNRFVVEENELMYVLEVYNTHDFITLRVYTPIESVKTDDDVVKCESFINIINNRMFDTIELVKGDDIYCLQLVTKLWYTRTLNKSALNELLTMAKSQLRCALMELNAISK